MFTYLHCYMPETWDAQIRAGLVRPGDGIRFSQSIDIAESLKFNYLARIDGELYRYVKETRCPFYIDRLQGGCFLEEYPYDKELVNAYRTLLGENFWGFQMHEWMSNVRSDLSKIINNNCPAWTAEAITETIRKAFPFKNTFLEAMNAKEYAEMGIPQSFEDYLLEMEKLFCKRQVQVDGDLIPCDSAMQAQPLEIRNGAKRLITEIGAQTANTRIQVAFTRGMARAAGIPFGTYYEPWGGSPFSACCYHREEKNEWNIIAESLPFHTAGDNGGSSRSLQHRLHLYSYMAGASFMAEEWGMCNTFYDWENFELTPYGKVKKDFLDFVDQYPDIGEPVIKAALVLPKEMLVLDLALSHDTYLSYPVDGAFQNKLTTVVNALNLLFVDSAPMSGTETGSLRNCLTPDSIDIITEDSPTVNQYSILIDATCNPTFREEYRQSIVDVQKAAECLNALLPVQLQGGASMQITYNQETGIYYVLLLNNSGVCRTVADGETYLPEANISVTLTVKSGKPLQQLQGNGSILYNEGKNYSISVPAGGWFFAKV